MGEENGAKGGKKDDIVKKKRKDKNVLFPFGYGWQKMGLIMKS